MTNPEGSRPRIGLVLAGGAARGAYEVGVVQHIIEQVGRDLGREVRFEVLCGTSVGALNVCALAAFADDPRRAARLSRRWTSLKVEDVVRPDPREVMSLLRRLFGRHAGPGRRGAVVDPTGLERLIRETVPFERIGEQLRAGRISAVTVSTTQVATGRTVVFVERREPGLPSWGQDRTVVPQATRIRIQHALASAAIPLLFPPVLIDGGYYCDGGLRQNVPLSPARRLGASALVVVNPRFIRPAVEPTAPGVPGPLFLLGKALNALLLDRIDSDIDRLERVNQLLFAGTRRYGTDFVAQINQELGRDPGRGIKPLRTVLIRTSQDIGRLAAEFVRSARFRDRARGMVGRVIRRLAEGEPATEADLLSYLLFDGDFAGQLIELGQSDAKARHEELCRFFVEVEGTLPEVVASGGG